MDNINDIYISDRQTGYAMMYFEPLHIPHGPVAIPVENLTISQQFNPVYGKEEAYGRMDPIATYKRTGRTININFSCQSHQIFDGQRGVVNNILNINTLTQFLYPAYEKMKDIENTLPLALLKAPPFFRMTYGNYVGSYDAIGDILGNESGLPGIIEGFSHQLGSIPRNVAHGRWFDRGPDLRTHWPEPIRALPREIKIGFTFTVIHDKQTGWVDGEFSPYGYGKNFPYNVGNFEMQQTAQALAPAVAAQQKAEAAEEKLEGKKAAALKDCDKDDQCRRDVNQAFGKDLRKARVNSAKADAKLRSATGPHAKVNQAQTAHALKQLGAGKNFGAAK